MSRVGKGASAASIVIGIVLLGLGGALLLGTSGTSASGVGGALTGLGQALGVGIGMLGGLLLLIGVVGTARSSTGSAHEPPAAPWPPVIDRPQREEAAAPPVASTVNDRTQTDR